MLTDPTIIEKISTQPVQIAVTGPSAVTDSLYGWISTFRLGCNKKNCITCNSFPQPGSRIDRLELSIGPISADMRIRLLGALKSLPVTCTIELKG